MIGPAQFAWMRVWLSAPTSLPLYPHPSTLRTSEAVDAAAAAEGGADPRECRRSSQEGGTWSSCGTASGANLFPSRTRSRDYMFFSPLPNLPTRGFDFLTTGKGSLLKFSSLFGGGAARTSDRLAAPSPATVYINGLARRIMDYRIIFMCY